MQCVHYTVVPPSPRFLGTFLPDPKALSDVDPGPLRGIARISDLTLATAAESGIVRLWRAEDKGEERNRFDPVLVGLEGEGRRRKKRKEKEKEEMGQKTEEEREKQLVRERGRSFSFGPIRVSFFTPHRPPSSLAVVSARWFSVPATFVSWPREGRRRTCSCGTWRGRRRDRCSGQRTSNRTSSS